jgi:hypothetical protein
MNIMPIRHLLITTFVVSSRRMALSATSVPSSSAPISRL